MAGINKALHKGHDLYANLSHFLATSTPSTTFDRPDLVIITPEKISILKLTSGYNAPSALRLQKMRIVDKYVALAVHLERRGPPGTT